MKVVHIIDSLRVGGAQALLITYTKEAAFRGLNTNIISLQESYESPIISELESLGASVIYLSKARLWSISRFLRLFISIKRGGYNIIHSHLTYANILGLICGTLLNIPVVVSMHSTLSSKRQYKPRDLLERILLRTAKMIIAVGENVGADYQKIYPHQVKVLPNAVNEPSELTKKERALLRQELNIKDDDILLVAIGRLREGKGFRDLLAAFGKIHLKHPNAKLIIAGDGNLRNELLEETRDRNLLDSVKWLGVRNDVPRILAASDVYISSSHWEGLSIALLEAMSAGLAPVVTNVGDAMEVIVPGSGILVTPKDPGNLADAIETLLNDPALIHQMGLAAKERVRSKYSAQIWFDKLLDIYEDLMR